MTESINDNNAKISKGKKIRYLWKEQSMNELLQQLHGQSSALNLLLRALDSSSIDQILTILQSGQHTFQEVRRGAASIRQSHPQEDYAESIVNMKSNDTQTLYSLDDYEAFPSQNEMDPIASQLDSTILPPDSNSESQSSAIGGWSPDVGQKHYNAEYDCWYGIDPNSGQVRWLAPTSVPKESPENTAVSPRRVPIQKPMPVQQPKLASPSPPVQIQPSSSSPQSPPVSHGTLDFAPWKMNTDAKFKTALENLRKEMSAPAIAVGIVSVDAPPKIHVVGYRRKGSDVPVTRADCFSILVSNPFTNTVTGVLVERGLFRWEETVLELFPSLASRVHPFHHQTTLAMLGAHLSGFEAYIGTVEEGELWDYIRHGGASAKEQRLAVAMSYLSRPPDRTPGTGTEWGGYKYNLVNPILIASAMEHRTGSTLEALVQSLVFDPLEMYSARFGRPDAAKNASLSDAPTQPWGHYANNREPLDIGAHYFPQGAFYASTGIFCSPPDYAAFVEMILRAAMGMPTPVVNGATDIGKRLFTKLPDKFSTPGSWLTWHCDWAGGEAIFMNGRRDGWACTTWIAPLKGKAYFALVNVTGDPGMKIANDACNSAIRHSIR